MLEEAVHEASRRLEARGSRATPQRMAVLTTLMAQQRYVTAQDLPMTLRCVQPHLGLATVYRTLELLVDYGLAEAFPQANNEVRYTSCSERHHHHLVCTTCDLVAEIPGCSLEGIERDIERQNSFNINDHAPTFFGTCQDCVAHSAAVVTTA